MDPEETSTPSVVQLSSEERQPVIVTSSTFPLAPDDGIPRFVYDLAEHLSRYMRVTAVVPDAPTAADRERMGRVDVRRFRYFWPRSRQCLAYGGGMPDNLRSSMLARLQVPFFLGSSVRAIKTAMEETRAQIVNAHWLVPQGLAAAMACGKDPNVKLVIHAHSSDVHLLKRIPGGPAVARFIVGRSDLIFASSDFVRSQLDEILESASEARIQPMGVDRVLFAASTRNEQPQDHRITELLNRFPDGYLLFVGRLVPVKGVTHLLGALQSLQRSHPGLGLVIVGDGPSRAELGQETRALGLEDAVAFEGALPHREVSQYLRHARVLALPSIEGLHGETEGAPTVLVEAMSSGTRVIASDVGGVSDLVKDGQTGWLCGPGDAGDLAESISKALADPDPSTIVSAAMRETNRYEWEEVARSYANSLFNLLD